MASQVIKEIYPILVMGKCMNVRTLIKHRNNCYYDALDRLIQGKESPEYVRYRWKKLKLVKKK
jgi:hypothetical protein